MDYFRRLRERLHTVHQLARRTLEGAGARQKRAYDTRAHGPMLGAGDRVWVFCPQRKRGLTPKLMSHWQGPGEILEQLSEVVFRVHMPGRGRRVVLHKDRLAPYHPLAPNPQTGVQPGDSLPPTPSPDGGAMDPQSRPKRTRRRPGYLLDYRVDS
uniref:Integrase p58-like C-terminal domain-containing protein n=1 Tax=Nothobranchius korthausae TaxID=1143690 RepID=A0A1A8GAE5_9TELE